MNNESQISNMEKESKIEIAIATPEDAEGIQEVRHQTWLKTYPNEKLGITIEDIEDRFKDRNSEENLARWKNPKNEVIFVAREMGKVIGFCVVEEQEDKNQLQAIYILPEYQGKGTGKMLWSKAQETLNPKKNTIVQVADYNESTIAFYEKLGFTDTGKRWRDEKYKLKSGSVIPEMEMIKKQMTSSKQIKKFQKTVWDFYKKNKRSFPWRETTDPYKILVSEIMLQQTQADRVVVFYEKWLKRFPDFKALAGAKFSEIYPYWQGLGYNRRALNLQKAAQKAMEEYAGRLPSGVSGVGHLNEFPGIGPYTARAVSIFSFNTPVACIETNIRRVFIHHFFPRKKSVTDIEILKIAELALDKKNSREWHWALMDYGAYLKSTVKNPNRRAKNYNVQSKFEGSLRQIRGAVLRNLMGENMTKPQLIKVSASSADRAEIVISALEKEGLIKQSKKVYSLN